MLMFRTNYSMVATLVGPQFLVEFPKSELLDPCCFYYNYVNGIPSFVESSVLLFGDDSKIYIDQMAI